MTMSLERLWGSIDFGQSGCRLLAPDLTGLADDPFIEGKADLPVEHRDFRV